MTTRPTWPEYFQQHAALASSRATCPRAACGAVIVKDRRIIATGYNGAPSGHPHCVDVGCEMREGHCQRVIHAEVNAIGQAAQLGIAVAGATMYIHRANVESDGRGPCRECCKVMKAAGIWDYYTENGEADMRHLLTAGDILRATSDIDLADVPDHSLIARYGTLPAEQVKSMREQRLIRKVMHHDMVYGYLMTPAVPAVAKALDQECKFCGKAFATVVELYRHQDVPGAACEEQYEQLYGGSNA